MIDYLAEIKANAAIQGLTLYSLCEKSGVAISNVPRWEKGITEPNTSTLKKLSSTLELLKRQKPKRKKS